MNLRGYLVKSPNSLGAKARERRWRMVQDAFPDLADMTVLDLGGRVEFWLRAPVRPAHVTVLNLNERHLGTPRSWVTTVAGNACSPPATVRAGSYDLVFSNSLLEHVGGYAQQVLLSKVIHECAPHHWVQTPYRYFPIEPHWLFPGFQFLPLNVRAALSQRWPLAYVKPQTHRQAVRNAITVELVCKTRMRYLFPDSRIVSEKMAGLTKSLIAVR